jgi:hypothetical protein
LVEGAVGEALREEEGGRTTERAGSIGAAMETVTADGREGLAVVFKWVEEGPKAERRCYRGEDREGLVWFRGVDTLHQGLGTESPMVRNKQIRSRRLRAQLIRKEKMRLMSQWRRQQGKRKKGWRVQGQA